MADEFDDELNPDVERANEVEDFTDGIERPAGEPAADTAGREAAEDEAAALVEHDVEALLAERDTFKDAALRLQADFENYRKRVTAQHGDDIDRATGRLAESLLPVLDACEAAFVQHPAEIEPLFNLLLGELRKQGLEAMHLDGQPFDPTLAEAVLHEPGDGSTDTPVVSEVLRSGYTWKGKVLRAAMVKVAG
ncbi:MAG: nucleotide exchange factor GrpE [Ilumatobacteraceae bacterium]